MLQTLPWPHLPALRPLLSRSLSPAAPGASSVPRWQRLLVLLPSLPAAGCFLWLLAFVPPGAAVLALIWWAARLRRRPARAVLRRGPEVSCFPSPRHEAVGTAGGRSSQAARPGVLARAKHPLQLQAQRCPNRAASRSLLQAECEYAALGH